MVRDLVTDINEAVSSKLEECSEFFEEDSKNYGFIPDLRPAQVEAINQQVRGTRFLYRVYSIR